MAKEFRLPDIGEGLTEAEIVRWLVDEGERVEADQPVVEVETDKAVVEIPSPFAGIILQHGGKAGDVIEVGSVLLVVGEEGEVATSDATDEQAQSEDEHSQSDAARPTAEDWDRTDDPSSVAQQAAPIVGTLSEDAEVLEPRGSAPSAASSDGIKALPLVRKLARDNGIDLAAVQGSGPGGRITREDVQKAIDARDRPREPAPVRSEEPAPAQSEPERRPDDRAAPKREPVSQERPADGETQKMSRLRRTIAANMAKSWAEIPHVTTFDDIDATRLLETRAALSHRHEKKIPLEALAIKAVLPALDAYPEFNSTIDGDSLILHSARDVGIAVDTPDGLLVGVIRDADEMSVLELADEVVRLGRGARDRSLTPDELTGQTFTLSNIGAVGGGHGTPIVPYGTTAILSIGRAMYKPVVYDGDIVVAPVMPLSLSYDHRVIDGAQGRRFMALLIENLEEPALFLAS